MMSDEPKLDRRQLLALGAGVAAAASQTAFAQDAGPALDLSDHSPKNRVNDKFR